MSEMSVKAAGLALEADILAMNEALRRSIEAARRASKTANRPSKGKPEQMRPFIGLPPWAIEGGG